MSTRHNIEALFWQLQKQPEIQFPKAGQPLAAPKAHGVYVIRGPDGRVAHVGRSVSGKAGLFQRLSNHLHSQSSFVVAHLKGSGSKLRGRYTFQLLEVLNGHDRALLEHFSIAWHCPAHLGVGKKEGT